MTEVGETMLGELREEGTRGQADEDTSPEGALSTARDGIISHYQALVSELDRDLIVDSLPALLTSAEGLLRFFDIEGIDQIRQLQAELVQPGSKASKRLSNLADAFEMAKRNFGDSSEIELEIILPFIAGLTRPEPLKHGIWRPDGVLYMANLARYLLALLTMDQNGEERGQLLDSFHNAFPIYFTRDRISESTVSIALELRTQRLIHLLIDEQNFTSSTAEEMITEVFFTPKGDLRGLDSSEEERPASINVAATFSQRIATLKSFLSEDSTRVVNVDELTAAFPYDVFLTQILNWVQLLAKDHREALRKQGGILAVQEAIQALQTRNQKIGRRHFDATQTQDQQGPRDRGGTSADKSMVASRDQPTKDSNSPRIKRPHRDLRKSGDLEEANATAFKKRRSLLEAKKAQTIPGPSAARLNDPTELMETVFQAMGDDKEPARFPALFEADEFPRASQRNQELSKNRERINAVANKENVNTPRRKPRFVDRQPGAERVIFDSQEDNVSLVVRKRNVRKRKARDEDSQEDEEEDDFEEDIRATNPVLRRAISTQIRKGSPPKRPRLEDQIDLGTHDFEDEDDETAIVGNLQQREEIATAERSRALSERRQRAPRSTSALSAVGRTPLQERDDRRPSSSAPVHHGSEIKMGRTAAAINKLAKENVRTMMPRKPQMRSAWTYEETGRLIDLITAIEKDRVSWVALKIEDECQEDGPLLEHRDQVSLKDKARNIKMDFLK